MTMPTAARQLCYCGAIKQGNRCPRCGHGPPRHSQTTKQRGYDSKWKGLSKQVRELIPVCIACWHEGRTTIATDRAPLHCHHIAKVVDAPERRLDPDNLLTMCEACHKAADAIHDSDKQRYTEWMERLKATRETLT